MLVCVVLTAGWQSDDAAVESSVAAFRERMGAEQRSTDTRPAGQAAIDAVPTTSAAPLIYPVTSQESLPARQALVAQPDVTIQLSPDAVLSEIPDPTEAEQAFARRYAALKEAGREMRVLRNYERVSAKALEYLKRLERPQRVQVPLIECIQRALQNNYAIRIEGFQPAIRETQVVEAEAAFDAAFFLDTTYSNQDRPTASQLNSAQSDLRSLRGGLRKMTATGMEASVGLNYAKNFVNNQFTTINPSYVTTFVASLRQPLLRGFGLDYNRSFIEIARVDQRIASERFEQQVRDSLFDVEAAYWELMQRRRQVMVLAESVGQYYATYRSMDERKGQDATPVEINNSLSNWKSQEVRLFEAMRLVRDAEDRLKNLVNDPQFKLSDELELIPTDTPLVAPLAVDQFADVRTALDERSEIDQSRLQIEQTRIQTMRAKNETMPQLDLSFNYEVEGLSNSADSSWDRMTTNRFRSYAVTLNFSYPLGNRGPQAALQRAQLQERQAIVGLHRTMDAVVEEVNNAVRTLVQRYEDMPPQLIAARAAVLNLQALQARSVVINPTFLQTELQAVEQITNTRTTLLRVVIDYNIAIVALERAKGTLLEYNNIQIADARSSR